ncbi:MAG: Coenzyme F420 hydrogenase/dehydrogenase, beta subunit C-terminal domain [Sphaerochaeta sp.]
MPPFPPQGAGYLTLLSRHSLGNGTMVMLVLLSLRWGMSLDFQSGTKKIEASNSTFYSLFIDGTILRPCCYECKFTNFNRPSDITIGDFWGIEQTFPLFDDEKGISLILVNSRKGGAFFQSASELLSCLQSTHTDCLQHSLFAPTSSHANKEAFWEDYEEHGYLFAGKKYGGGR